MQPGARGRQAPATTREAAQLGLTIPLIGSLGPLGSAGGRPGSALPPEARRSGAHHRHRRWVPAAGHTLHAPGCLRCCSLPAAAVTSVVFVVGLTWIMGWQLRPALFAATHLLQLFCVDSSARRAVHPERAQAGLPHEHGRRRLYAALCGWQDARALTEEAAYSLLDWEGSPHVCWQAGTPHCALDSPTGKQPDMPAAAVYAV